MESENTLRLDRWLALGEKLGVSLTADAFAELLSRYDEPQRFYHTAAHIVDCLRQFDAAPIAGQADGPVVEFALWMHDVVYDPKAADNEQHSADLACKWLLDAGSDSELAESVSRLIMATAHGASDSESAGVGGENTAADWVVDIDLSILGRSPERFIAFGEEIRQEYCHVKSADYFAGRLSVLRLFQSEEALYRTAWFAERFEEAAKQNLNTEIKLLEKRQLVS